MKLLMEQFLFLSYLLHMMGEEISMDEHGLTVEQFEIIDVELEKILHEYDVDKVKQEILELIKMITEGK